MKMKTSHLMPGYVLQKDIIGKSNRPIALKGTELTEHQIQMIRKFLVDTVEIDEPLSGNKPSKKVKKETEEEKEAVVNIRSTSLQDKGNEHFLKEYKKAVNAFKGQFQQWQQSMPISIPDLRDAIIPLLEQLDNLDAHVIFSLHKYARSEEYIFHHSVATSLISAFIAKEMGYRRGEWIQVGLAGALCDCGMAKLDTDVIEKQGPLTSEEFKNIKKHPQTSYVMIKDLPSLTSGVQLAVLQHHERGNGEGYPLGMTLNKVHPYARIIAVADSYHAMATTTCYRKARNIVNVIEELHVSTIRLYDSDVVNTFMNIFSNWLEHSQVILNNGIPGEVVFVNKNEPTRPIVKSNESDDIFSLEQLPELYIDKIIG
ncbi:HD-GYP domain-containing protein [Oceanobacillus sp. 1P07AA]|uniref:HD-GYP domain-containing protein n=1 Tax=Oceanobacillus sp. 1P07AA TaxID=3132293 RepID=UPI0039A426FF